MRLSYSYVLKNNCKLLILFLAINFFSFADIIINHECLDVFFLQKFQLNGCRNGHVSLYCAVCFVASFYSLVLKIFLTMNADVLILMHGKMI